MGNRLIRDYAKIAAAQVGFKTTFNKGLDQAPDEMAELGMVVKSDSDTEEYDWFGEVPGLSLWTDQRELGGIRGDSQRIKNHSWSNGIKIHLNSILDDKLHKVDPLIKGLAAAAMDFAPWMIGRMLINGFDGLPEAEISTGKSFDGKFFFSTTHQVGDGPVNSNLLTAVLSNDSYKDARALMRKWRNESGRRGYRLKGNVLIVGPDNERLALEIVGANQRAVANGPIDNVFKGQTRVAVCDELVDSYANYWGLADTTKPIKPIIVQERAKPSFAYVSSDQNNDVFMSEIIKAGAKARYGFGYGWPQTCVGSTGAG